MAAFLEPPLLCTQHRGRDQDGDEGDDPSVASSHGLSSDDHDDAGVDADPTAGWQKVQCGGLRRTRVRGVPLACEALCFSESVRRQLVCNSVAKADRRLSVLTSTS